MKRIWVHIGFHKTGSSAIQESLFNQREVLLEAGLGYPKPLCRFPSHGDLAWCFMGDRAHWRDRDYEIDEVKDYYQDQVERTSAKDLVISSEDISLLNERQVQEVATWFNGQDLRVLAFMRDPISQLVSRYHHAVLTGQVQVSFKDFLATKSKGLESFPRVLNYWSLAVGPEKLYSIEYSSNAVNDFYSKIGYAELAPEVEKRVGIGVHPWLVDSYRKIPETNDGKTLKERLVKIGRDLPKVDALEHHVGKQEAENLRKQYSLQSIYDQLQKL